MTSKTTVPEFEATAIEAIPDIARTVRQTFRTHKTKDVEWRLVQLRKLYWSLTDLAPVIAEALHRDLRKSRYEAFLSEIDWLRDDCMFMIRHLKSFARDEKLGSPWAPC
ncbi:hypothetical protein VTK73DRAFT_5654 [Phialemonium thermophilum]|uniref:Uncharacterized protein n=1 Tax=Phialemonium thermophilum TaxID=223376 RepID=A0ABR3V0W2_9PEZI